MARYRNSRGYRRSGGRRPNSAALIHIAEAKQFSNEVGGVDKDVKSFFFSLSSYERDALFIEYGEKYGEDRRLYAIDAYPFWKSGTRQMSGDVAKRLFDLLPKRMPLPKKYELVRKLWDHFCPKTHEVFYVGNGANTDILHGKVSAHLEKVVQNYTISEALSKRFDWLSAGDVVVRLQLQNHFQQLKRACLAEALKERLQVVSSHLTNCPEDHVLQTVKLGNHVVEIKCTHLVEGEPDIATVNQVREQNRLAEEQKRLAEARKQNFQTTVGWLFMIAVVIILFKSCGR